MKKNVYKLQQNQIDKVLVEINQRNSPMKYMMLRHDEGGRTYVVLAQILGSRGVVVKWGFSVYKFNYIVGGRPSLSLCKTTGEKIWTDTYEVIGCYTDAVAEYIVETVTLVYPEYPDELNLGLHLSRRFTKIELYKA